MTNEKLDNSTLNDIDFENIDIEKNIDKDIDEYIKEFTIDNSALDLISIPHNLEDSVKLPFREVKKEKRKRGKKIF